MTTYAKTFEQLGPGPGRVAYWDEQNEKFPVAKMLTAEAKRVAATDAPIVSKIRFPRFRAWRRFDQGPTPRCTAFASMTLRDAAHVRDPELFRGGKLGDFDAAGQSLYEQIQRIDRERHGVNVGPDGGATMLAALKAGRERGWWAGFRWALNFDEIRASLLVAPVLAGVPWYSSQYERDADGIAHITARARLDGGHALVINHYDAKRDLYRCPNTWGDGDYWLTGADLKRSFDEGGEFAVVTETAPSRG